MTTQSSSNTPTGASGTILQGQGVGTASAFTTATYPATTTINRILYSSANNTVGQITSANSAILVTTSSGVPQMSSTMTNGQLIIGSTSGTPTAATITAGSNITVTNGAGSITIAATGGGVATGWVSITSFSLSSTASPLTVTSGITTYNNVVIEFLNMQISAGAHLSIGLSTDGGSTYTAGSGNVYVLNGSGSIAAAFNTSSGGAVQVDLGTGLAGSTNTNGYIILSNSNVTSLKTITGMFSQGSVGSTFNINGYFNSMTQFNALEIVLSTGNFASGTVKIWGY